MGIVLTEGERKVSEREIPYLWSINTITRGCQAYIVVRVQKKSIYSMGSRKCHTGGLTLGRQGQDLRP